MRRAPAEPQLEGYQADRALHGASPTGSGARGRDRPCAVVVLPSPSPVPGRRVGRRVLRVLARVLVLVVIAVTALAAGYAGWADLRPVRIDVGVGGTRVTAAGVDTHVEAWPAEHPHGLPPLVLIPGFAESTYVWSRVAPLLARDRDVYAYDVRGYGTTDHLPPYTLAADADQLGGLLAALGLTGPRRPVVVGHSLGAAVALAQALREPASVVGVVLANGDGTPFGVGPGWVRSLLVDPFASAVVDVVVRHRGPVRTLVAGACGPAAPSTTRPWTAGARRSSPRAAPRPSSPSCAAR